MITVKEIWSLKIRHEYCKTGICRWGEVRISSECKDMLGRRGCFLQDYRHGECKLLCYSEEKEVFTAEDKLELIFFDRLGRMAENTDYDWKSYRDYPVIHADASKDTIIDMRKQPGKIEPSQELIEFKMIIPLHQLDLNRTTVTEVQYAAAYKSFTYYFIPHDGNINRKLEIVVNNMDLKFIEAGGDFIDFGQPSLCFESTKEVKLTENTIIKATLYEIIGNGIRKPLIQELPTHLSYHNACDISDTMKLVYF